MKLKAEFVPQTSEQISSFSPGQHLKLIGSVLVWELFRLLVRPLSWLLTLAVFGFFGVLVLFKHNWVLSDKQISIVATTSFGLLYQQAAVLLLVFGMFLPFVATDTVAHDYRERTHELLMTTPLPDWVYLLGRYLAALVISLGLALIMVLAQVGFGLVLHLTNRDIPAPQLSGLLSSWLVLVLPATLVLTSLAFIGGTLWPQLSIVIKLGLLIVWVLLTVLDVATRVGEWVDYWTPGGFGILKVVTKQFIQTYQTQASFLNLKESDQAQVLALQLQQALPDLSGWLVPHLVLVGLSLLVVGLGASQFRRFRGVLN